MEIKDVVCKLIGPITPVGETTCDDKRFKNLKELCSLVEDLIGDISDCISNKHSTEYSVKRAGEYAEKFIESITTK